MALYNLNQAYIGLKEEEEEEEEKEQVKLLGDYVQSVLVGENPFIKEKERKERDVLKGLVEEVRALRKEVALKTQTYAEKLKKGLSSSTFAHSSTTSSSTTSPSPPTSSTSSTSTRGKKKQLQERRLVLVTDQKD